MDSEALCFVDTLLEPLQKSARFTMEGIITEFNQLKKLVHRLKRECEHVEDDVKAQFAEFLVELESQRQQEESAERRRRAQEGTSDRRKVSFNASAKAEDRKIVDNIVDEIRRGKVLRRLSLRKKTSNNVTGRVGGL